MLDAYCALHAQGHAHSIECWNDETLVGGVYGVAIGQVFFAESMFSRATNGSKMALIALCEYLQAWDYQLIDCQLQNAHLATLGVELMTRSDFCMLLEDACAAVPSNNAWRAR
jgi:leucyl/phenylalanyl-tRNA---protein transferase